MMYIDTPKFIWRQDQHWHHDTCKQSADHFVIERLIGISERTVTNTGTVPRTTQPSKAR